jgi:hypothetical protein
MRFISVESDKFVGDMGRFHRLAHLVPEPGQPGKASPVIVDDFFEAFGSSRHVVPCGMSGDRTKAQLLAGGLEGVLQAAKAVADATMIVEITPE